ncbi:hypothetical protein [Pseudocolwellia agarivorans]|uniref:hypothetical protein n=1 Tax=Pseudocolwellia agarivorans TaxID=1911682 RepID=UPI0009879DF2|nr:hypothetical protein [Pseudocolwellia agarivorans]
MNNVSLVKVTLGVAFAAVATFIVNANEINPTVADIKNEIAAETTASMQSPSFSDLLSTFDADENGSLSESELSSSALQSDFSSIDTDGDTNISEDEFNAYVASK